MHLSEHRSASAVVRVALGATLALVLTEFVAGYLAHSLALISDAWHNLTDIPSLVLAGIAIYFERKLPDEHRTYGYQRAFPDTSQEYFFDPVEQTQSRR